MGRRVRAAPSDSQRRLSVAIAVARLGAYELDLETGEANLDGRAREIFGFHPDEAITVSDVRDRIVADDLPRHRAGFGALEASGGSPSESELRILLPDGSIRIAADLADYVRGPDRRVRRIVGVFHDITDRRRAEARQRLLINELNHRVKNTLATVQSIAAQTLRSAADLPSARETFEARLLALAAAHDLLNKENWEGARLDDIAAAALAPFYAAEAPQIAVEGPSLWLTAQTALALCMALHELATNAAKYGALCSAEGRVNLRWGLAGESELLLSWAEQGGPPVTAPIRLGFGARMLQRSLPRELAGDVILTFPPEGVRCEIRFTTQHPHSKPETCLEEALARCAPDVVF